MKYYVVLLLLVFILIRCKTESGVIVLDEEVKSSDVIMSAAPVLLYEKSKNEEVNSVGDIKIAYKVLTSGNNFKDGLSSIIRKQEDLDTTYSILYGTSVKAPKIDFSKNAVVIAAGGNFSTGGYSVELFSAHNINKLLNLVFEVKKTDPKEIVTQAFTKPYTIISIEAEMDAEIIVKFLPSSNAKILLEE